MKEKKKFGFTSQDYIAPRAEGVEFAQDGILCASTVIGNTLENFSRGENGQW